MDDNEDIPFMPPPVEPVRLVRRFRKAGDHDDRNGAPAKPGVQGFQTLVRRRDMLPPTPANPTADPNGSA